MKRQLALLLASGLAACSLGPPYRRPELDVPAAYRGQPEAPGDASLGDASWWDVYRDPRLRQLIATALAQNRDIKIAAARVEEARAQVGVARLGQYPQVDVGVSGGRAHTLLGGEYVTGSQWGANLQASFEIDFWHRLAKLSEAARAELLATELARDNVRTSLVGDVATAYFDLSSLDRQMRLTQATVANRERFLTLTQRKHGHGAASGLDVTRAEATLALVRANLPELRRQIEQRENQLQILLGQNPGPVEREALDPGALPIPPKVPAGLPSTLLERRPDVRQAEALLISASAQVGAARAAIFPTISLTGSAGVQSLELSTLLKGSARVWSLGIGLLQPLLDASRNGYRIDVAKARAEQARLQYQQTVAQAFRDVSDALIARRDDAEFLQAQQQQVDALRAASRRVHKRYEVGFSAYFEVIDADRDLYAAELQLAQAYRNNMVALVQLYKALGGGWQGAGSAVALAAGQPP